VTYKLRELGVREDRGFLGGLLGLEEQLLEDEKIIELPVALALYDPGPWQLQAEKLL